MMVLQDGMMDSISLPNKDLDHGYLAEEDLPKLWSAAAVPLIVWT